LTILLGASISGVTLRRCVNEDDIIGGIPSFSSIVLSMLVNVPHERDLSLAWLPSWRQIIIDVDHFNMTALMASF